MQHIELPNIPAPDQSLAESVQLAIDQKTKPVGALGDLEPLAKKIALAQGTLAPQAESCRLLLFAADHGVATAGVSAYPQEVTRQMVLNFLAGGAAANVFSTVNEVDLTIIDAGIVGEPISHPALISSRQGNGTRNFVSEPAMDQDQLTAAIAAGVSLGQSGNQPFVAFGEMGIGNTSSAAMLIHKLLGASLSHTVGPGTGLDGAGVQQKIATLEEAANRTPNHLAPDDYLSEYGGFEIAQMVGAMIGAAAKRRCLLIDGFITTAAWLAASLLKPEIREYSIFCHQSTEPGHKVIFEKLGEKPLLNLDLRLGEGTGSLLAWPLIKCAVRMLTDMATFESSGVSAKS